MKCPYCGGNIEIKENSVEQIEYKCPYCDGIVKVESNEPKTKFGLMRKMGKDYLEYRAKDKQAEREAQQKGKETFTDKLIAIIVIVILGAICLWIFSQVGATLD